MAKSKCKPPTLPLLLPHRCSCRSVEMAAEQSRSSETWSGPDTAAVGRLRSRCSTRRSSSCRTGDYKGPGVSVRVMDIYTFMNSKVSTVDPALRCKPWRVPAASPQSHAGLRGSDGQGHQNCILCSALAEGCCLLPKPRRMFPSIATTSTEPEQGILGRWCAFVSQNMLVHACRRHPVLCMPVAC